MLAIDTGSGVSPGGGRSGGPWPRRLSSGNPVSPPADPAAAAAALRTTSDPVSPPTDGPGSLLGPRVAKRPWTQQEDDVVREMVGLHGPKQWSQIAAKIPGREGKQCRERWLNHLRPDLRKDNWTTAEAEILLQQQARLGNQWVEIARHLPGRTDNSVKNYWNSRAMRRTRAQLGLDAGVPAAESAPAGGGVGSGGVLQPLSRHTNDQNRGALRDCEALGVSMKAAKRPWTQQEDDVVREMVGLHGPKQWSQIAAKIPGREGKQCRERWLNHLRPDLRKDNWTTAEAEILLQQQARLGNQWVEIARHLPGRTDNSVKNYWNSHAMRQHRGRALGAQAAGAAADLRRQQPAASPTATAPALLQDNHEVAMSQLLAVQEAREHTLLDPAASDAAMGLRGMLAGSSPQLSTEAVSAATAAGVAELPPSTKRAMPEPGAGAVPTSAAQHNATSAARELKRQRCAAQSVPHQPTTENSESELDQQATAWLLDFAGCL